MDIQNAFDYLLKKDIFQGTVSIKPITVGASGAKLFLANSSNHKYVVKIAHESFHKDSGHIEPIRRNWHFID